MSEKSAAEQAIERQAEKDRPQEGKASGEAHARGEKGKPTARDATGEKQEGFATGEARPAGEERIESTEERERLRGKAESSLP